MLSVCNLFIKYLLKQKMSKMKSKDYFINPQTRLTTK